jgi:hypothetical protein
MRRTKLKLLSPIAFATLPTNYLSASKFGAGAQARFNSWWVSAIFPQSNMLGFCSPQDYLSKVRTQTLSDSVPDGGAANSLGTPAGKILIGLRTVLKC